MKFLQTDSSLDKKMSSTFGTRSTLDHDGNIDVKEQLRRAAEERSRKRKVDGDFYADSYGQVKFRKHDS